MYGVGIGKLEVYVIYAKHKFVEKLLFLKSGNQGKLWQSHQLQFRPQFNEYQVGNLHYYNCMAKIAVM